MPGALGKSSDVAGVFMRRSVLPQCPSPVYCATQELPIAILDVFFSSPQASAETPALIDHFPLPSRPHQSASGRIRRVREMRPVPMRVPRRSGSRRSGPRRSGTRPQVRAAQVRAAQVRALRSGAAQVPRRSGPRRSGSRRSGTRPQVRAAQVRAAQVRAAQVRAAQVAPLRSRAAQVRASSGPAPQVRAAQVPRLPPA